MKVRRFQNYCLHEEKRLLREESGACLQGLHPKNPSLMPFLAWELTYDLAPLKWSSCASGGRHERRGQGVFPAFIAALGTRRAHMLAFFKP